ARVQHRVEAGAGFSPATDYHHIGGRERIDVKDRRADHRAPPDSRAWSPEERLFKPVTDRAERRAIARQLSPIYSVSRQSPPTLLVHGDRDEVVPLQQSQSFVDRLKEVGVPAELVVKKGAGHDLGLVPKDMGTVCD